MIRRVIELLILVILLALVVVGSVYFFRWLGQNVTPSPEISSLLKYVWFGIMGLIALAIICGTFIALAAIILGIRWLKGITGENSGFKSGYPRGIGGFIRETVETALGSALHSIKDIKELSPRSVDVSMEFPYDNLKIKTNIGDIKIQGHSDKTLSGRIEIYEAIEGDAEVFFEDGEIKIKTKSGKKAKLGDIEILVPLSLNKIDVESINGDVSVNGLRVDSDAILKGVNGNISVKNFSNSKEVLIKTVNGDIKINESKLNILSLQSVSGDVVLSEITAESAVIKTVSGNIDYRDSDIKNPDIKTLSGEIKR